MLIRTLPGTDAIWSDPEAVARLLDLETVERIDQTFDQIESWLDDPAVRDCQVHPSQPMSQTDAVVASSHEQDDMMSRPASLAEVLLHCVRRLR